MTYLIDIDGTLLNGSEPLKGAIHFINKLNSSSIDFLLMTNSIKSIDVQIQRLSNAGFAVKKNNLLNPIIAINKYLLEKQIKKVKVIGSEDEISQIDAEIVDSNYDIAILLDFEKKNFGHMVLQHLINDLANGIEVITASKSMYYLKNGNKTIDTGAYVKLLEEISNTNIENYGKPSLRYFSIAGSLLNEKADQIYVVGDDFYTDIIGANEYGAKSILVKTGKYKLKDECKCNPFKVINSLEEL